MEKLTQSQRIIRHLQDYKTITPKEAINEYGIYRLAARISDLKKEGYEFTSKRVTAKSRYGDKTSFAEYSLAN